MNIEEIDYALIDLRYLGGIIDHENIDKIEKCLTTLRDLKQELKEVGDMPNELYLGNLTKKTYIGGHFHGNIKATEYTRTTPTLKKIMEGL